MSTTETQVGVNTNLQKQDLTNLNVSNLTPLSPEVISRQATINIGTIGHVAHGKSTVVKAISGVQTVRFKNELERNITIKLERMSLKLISALLSSPKLLSEYEESQEAKLKLKRWPRRDDSKNTNKSTKKVSSLGSQPNSTAAIANYDLFTHPLPPSMRCNSTSPSSGYESFNDNASSCYSGEYNVAASTSTVTSSVRRHRRSTPKTSSLLSSSSSNLILELKRTTLSTLNSRLKITTHPSKSSKTEIVSKHRNKRRLSSSLSSSTDIRNNENNMITMTNDGNNLTSSSTTIPNSPSSSNKRRKFETNSKVKEYTVERIESMESINGSPVFFVKWLNYPIDQNTWESWNNLMECAKLEPFIEENYALFELTIAEIISEIEAELDGDSEATATVLTKYNNNNNRNNNKINIQQLDEYEPLMVKADLILLAQFRNSGSRNQREPEKIRKRVLEMMLLKPFYYKRRQQLNDLRRWQDRMNRIEHVAPIQVENNVDLEVLDPDFQYVIENIAGNGVEISQDPPIGCKCIDACAPMSKCCARMADNYFAYDKTGRLRIHPGEAIYECNSKCACANDCVNRVIQRGRQNSLCLFRTATGCGWGLRTERAVRKGEYVCEYVGEIITAEEANERGHKYDAIGRTYLFDLDYNTAMDSMYTIDAAMHGNISHFINHSCDPNLAVFPFWINNLDINMPRLAFFSLRPIKAGEELTFDYIRIDVETGNDYQNLSEAEKVTCRCGADNCRKVLF